LRPTEKSGEELVQRRNISIGELCGKLDPKSATGSI
jgi:hypothetical protein